MRRSAFGRLHPAVAFALGGSVLCLSFFTKDPVFAGLLAAGALALDGELFGFFAVWKRFLLFLGITLISAASNPFISHRGVTVLFYLGNGAVTVEAAVYGAVSGAMLANVILWCEALYRALPPDAALYYPGKIFPRITLVFTMAIRFVPRLVHRFREARAAQRAFHPESTLQNAFAAMETGIALTLEECCEIARGMEERGYGQGKLSSYSLYRFRGRDAALTAVVLSLTACVVAGYAFGAYHFQCYPGISRGTASWIWYGPVVLLVLCPALVERREKLLWRSLKSSI